LATVATLSITLFPCVEFSPPPNPRLFTKFQPLLWGFCISPPMRIILLLLFVSFFFPPPSFTNASVIIKVTLNRPCVLHSVAVRPPSLCLPPDHLRLPGSLFFFVTPSPPTWPSRCPSLVHVPNFFGQNSGSAVPHMSSFYFDSPCACSFPQNMALIPPSLASPGQTLPRWL